MDDVEVPEIMLIMEDVDVSYLRLIVMDVSQAYETVLFYLQSSDCKCGNE